MGLGEHVGDPRVKSRSFKKSEDDESDEAPADGARNDRWRTGRRVLTHLERVMGPIGLDPSGHPAGLFASRTILLPEYAGAELARVAGFDDKHMIVEFNDGLTVPWFGRGLVFNNMPWSNIAPWIKKSQEADEVVLLTQARMNAIWLHEHGFEAGLTAVGFTRGRVPYETDKKVPQPPFHSVFLYRGPRFELFQQFMQTLPGGVRTKGGGVALRV